MLCLSDENLAEVTLHRYTKIWQTFFEEDALPVAIGKLEGCYLPQTKFTKVMFSQVSVCPRRRGCLLQFMLGYTSPGQTSPWADTPRQTRPSPGQTPPPAQLMLGYGQQAGGTHPTGKHSCSESKIAASSPLSLTSQKKTVRKETKSRILPAPSSYSRGNLIVRSAKKNLYNGLWTKFCMTPFHSIE